MSVESTGPKETRSEHLRSPESWRDEMYGDESGIDPFWVPVEASDGTDRDPIDAAVLCRGFVGRESFDAGLTVELVRGRMERLGTGVDGWWFTKDVHGDVMCWEVCCS